MNCVCIVAVAHAIALFSCPFLTSLCGFILSPPPGLACTQQQVQWFPTAKTYLDSNRLFRLHVDQTEDRPDRTTGVAFPLGKVSESFSLIPSSSHSGSNSSVGRLVLLPLPSHCVFTEDARATVPETDRRALTRTYIHMQSERRGGRQRALHTLNYAVELITWQSVPIALIGL